MTNSTGQKRVQVDHGRAADGERGEGQDVDANAIDADDPHKAEKLTRREDYDADDAVE